jgi:WD40 repeat protein/energy-coupling factor transporter ATP-binding protein EcfA2
MPESEDPKEPEKITNNDLRNSQNAGGVVNADTVNAQRIGGDIWNIQGDFVTFNQTQILQISVAEIKTRQFIQTSPYKGLKKFESADKDLFFGRDQFLTGLVNELEQTNLILLLGASGSGKSSVVRAGLIPWLSQKWGLRLVNLTLTPDTDPFESFYASLLSKYKQSEAQIAREAKGSTLTEVVKSLKEPDDNWFILIDQFEELFTTSLADKRDKFITSLVQLSKTKEHSVKIMATMRADFLDRLSPYPQLVKATDKHRPLIAEMQIDELRLAIEQPAAQYGVVFETGLVEEIIKDIQGQAGYLPLLQYTLNLLWDTEVQTSSINDRTLNISTYRELGGVRGALQKHVDQIYSALLEPEKLATQRIFLKLVGIGGDFESSTEWKPVRRRANRFEFSDQLEQSVLVKLINENLLVSDRQPQAQESTVEIAHEILLTSWETLNIWIKENRQVIALRNRLNDDVARWQSKKKEDELWSGSRLEQVLELRQDQTFNQVLGGFSETASKFIDASARRRDRRRRTTIIGLTTFSTFAFTLTGVAGVGWYSASLNQINAYLASSKAYLATDQKLDALIDSIKAGKQLRNTFGVDADTQLQVVNRLQQTVYNVREFNRLSWPTDSVETASFSPDGRIIATAGNDGTIKVWSLSGELLHTLKGHKGFIKSISFSPNGKIIASASSDQTVKVWSIDGKLLCTLKGHSREVIQVSFSPDGKTIASSSYDETIKLWNLKGELLHTIQHAYYSSFLFSPNGKIFASISDTVPNNINEVESIPKRNIINLWNLKGELIATFKAHEVDIENIRFISHGQILASADWNGIIKLWSTSGKLLHTLKEVGSSVRFSPDEKTIASSVYKDNTIKLWSLEGKLLNTIEQGGDIIGFSPNGQTITSIDDNNSINIWSISGELLYVLKGHTDEVLSVKFSPNGQTISSVSKDKTVRIWNLFNELPKTIKAHKGAVESVSFSPDGKIIVSASDDKTVKLWSLSGNLLHTLKGHTAPVKSVTFSPDGKTIASASDDKTVKLWSSSGNLLHTLKGHIDEVRSISFSPDGKTIASGDMSSEIRFWNLSGKLLNKIELNNANGVKSISFSPDGKTIAAAIWDIKLLDLSGKLLHNLEGHEDWVFNVTFSPDGQLIASASLDYTIRLWDSSGKLLKTFGGNEGSSSVSFNPDGKTIASSGGTTVSVWNLSGELLSTFKNNSGHVSSVSFSPDGQTIAFASGDGTVKLWDFSSHTTNLLAQGCNQLHDYLNNPNISKNNKHLCDGIRK